MVKLPTILLLLGPILAACLADVGDDPVGEVAEPGVSHGTRGPPSPSGPPSLESIPAGPCKDACLGLAVGSCDAAVNECLSERPPLRVTCQRQKVTCDTALVGAGAGNDLGLEVAVDDVAWCWRACQGLHD
jgi:hypothetical protein